MAKVLIFLIKIYQKTISFDHGIPSKLFPGRGVCIFTPTCSEYSIRALEKYGFFKGGWLSVKRILRCGPWSYNAEKYDPVP